jgi:CheY-like chemotaxis protein
MSEPCLTGRFVTLDPDPTTALKTSQEIPPAKTSAERRRIPANPPPRILVVEDNVAIRELNTQVLVRSGYQVDAAEDGAAGWEVLHTNNFDLLITDHDMPRLTGVELVKKARSEHMDLPIILATGTLPAEDIARHPWLQLAAVLLKPFTTEELLNSVRRALHEAHRSSMSH